MRFYIVAFLSVVLFGSAHTQKKSSIDFVIKNLGVNVDGHFNSFNINAVFDMSNTLTAVNGTIDISSIETGIESRDEHLLEVEYFDIENYPEIILTSKKVSLNSDGSYTLNVQLSIKDVKKDMSIPLVVEDNEKHWKLKSFFEINRRDFHVGGGSFILSKTVKISVIHYQDKE